MEFRHEPVLLAEVLQWMNVRENGVYCDGTLGGGGHSEAILKAPGGTARLFGIDRDENAIRAASERLKAYPGFTAIRGNFHDAKSLLAEAGAGPLDGALLDLGVSSPQLDNAERGFSYMEDAPLDMRMDRRQSQTAADLVNTATEQELFRIIRDYGEDRFAKNIAKHIVQARERKPVETTKELADIIRGAIPMKVQVTGGHPAMRTFQAIRIALNEELTVLENSIDTMIRLLKPGGRLSIITFHSLEDRIVKNGFRRNEHPCICPPGFPVCVCGRESLGTVITKKPILPTEEEIRENSRSHSAKLRVFERA